LRYEATWYGSSSPTFYSTLLEFIGIGRLSERENELHPLVGIEDFGLPVLQCLT
jgi:hypothetical protein